MIRADDPAAARRARTWWGQRWDALLERLAEPARCSQGRWHARAGRVAQLEVMTGGAVALLRGGQATPRTVIIEFRQLTVGQWERALDALAAQARFGAQLLNGYLPEDAEALFRRAGANLLPHAWDDVAMSCTCSEGRHEPCKHIAAVWYVLGERLDGDPFLLFLLRGRTKEAVLAALRDRRLRLAEAATAPASAPRVPDAFWTAPGGAAELTAIEALLGGSPEPAEDALPIKQLGPPPFRASAGDLQALLAAAYHAISEQGRLPTGAPPAPPGSTP